VSKGNALVTFFVYNDDDVANVLSITATYYLGVKVGFPLTQTCVLFLSMWGILYFKEINLAEAGLIWKYGAGVLLILLGSCLLILSSDE
jgi:glucose uptake protein GlcU